MLKFFEVEESSQKVILLITSQEFNKVPSRRGPFLSRSDPLSYEDLEIPAVCVSLVAPPCPPQTTDARKKKNKNSFKSFIKLCHIIRMNH